MLFYEQRRRLEQEKNSFEQSYELQSEKIARLRNALVIETDTLRKFQYEHQIKNAETELKRLNDRLDEIEKQLQSAQSIPVIYEPKNIPNIALNTLEIEYRKVVKLYVDYKQAKIFDKESEEILETKRHTFGISFEKSQEIIGSILKPLKNRQRYIEKYTEKCQSNFPIDKETLERLKEWQHDVLGLEDSFVREVEIEIDEFFFQQPDPLKSSRGIDYTELQNFLKANKWQKANEETTRLLLKASGREILGPLDSPSSIGTLGDRDIELIPCQDLYTIDNLWMKYSRKKFGFSIHLNIYKEVRDWHEFVKRVRWFSKESIEFSLKSPLGHLPTPPPHCCIGDIYHNVATIITKLAQCKGHDLSKLYPNYYTYPEK
ncbi:GUN4 domain-containing protein [Nostoc sp. TCL240-02]|uniref:GUN4 domain-containing protein n=1 Tax=Nostoc sp. TCL240-02 TaxID=2572090 RepID=UPI0020C66CA2|nr:GUN4 domain-containing protein [Nostoc sp. TCL240-02]